MSMKYAQDGGLLSNVQPGKRVKEQLQKLRGSGGPDVGQSGDMLDIPDNPGPAVAGRTPVLGSVRRANDMPVLRDRLGEQMD